MSVLGDRSLLSSACDADADGNEMQRGLEFVTSCCLAKGQSDAYTALHANASNRRRCRVHCEYLRLRRRDDSGRFTFLPVHAVCHKSDIILPE